MEQKYTHYCINCYLMNNSWPCKCLFKSGSTRETEINTPPHMHKLSLSIGNGMEKD